MIADTWKRLGIRSRLLVVVVASLVVSLTLVGLLRTAWERATFTDTVRAQGENLASVLSELTAEALYAQDEARLNWLIVNAIKGQDILSVTILDAGDETVTTIEKPPPDDPDAVQMALEHPIQWEGEEIGSVGLVFVPSGLKEGLQRFLLNNLLVDTLVVLAMSAVLFALLSQVVLRPLTTAIQAVSHVSKKKDLTASLPEDLPGAEFQALARAFNGFLAGLQETLRSTHGTTFRVSTVSDRVAMNTANITEAAEVQARSTEQASSAISEMDASIRNVASGVEALSSATGSSSSSILQMSSTIGQVAKSTDILSTAVEETTTSVTEMNQALQELANNAGQLAATAETTAKAVGGIEEAIGQVETSARESAALSERVRSDASKVGVPAVQKTMEGMARIQAAVEHAAEVIETLQGRAQQVDKILKVITDVTDRTTLLALNAAILAAQAGEHGRGFGVVADEIKDLAERTAASAQEIGEIIQGVQHGAQEAAVAMKEGLSSVAEGDRLSREAGEALRKILESSRQAAEQAHGIEQTTVVQAREVARVNEAVRQVNLMVEQVARTTEEQQSGSRMILDAVERVREFASQLQRAMSEQAVGSKQITQAVEEINSQIMVIVEATNEQRQGSAQIVESISRITQIPKENLAMAREMADAVQDLTQQADRFREFLQQYQFKRRDQQVALRLGVIPLEAKKVMEARYDPLVRYLSEKLGRPVELVVSQDYEACMRQIWDGELDLMGLTPTTYVEARHKYGVHPLAVPIRGGSPWSHAVIATRAADGVPNLEALMGRRFAFGDERSTTSYLIPRAMLARGGIRLLDLEAYAFLGHHDRVAEAVLAGEYDAGGLIQPTAEAYTSKGLRILAVSEDLPGFPLCASAELAPEIRNRIQELLVSLDGHDSLGGEVLQAMGKGYSGLGAIEDRDYEDMRKSMSEIYGLKYG